jgi:hypothetical protein
LLLLLLVQRYFTVSRACDGICHKRYCNSNSGICYFMEV